MLIVTCKYSLQHNVPQLAFLLFPKLHFSFEILYNSFSELVATIFMMQQVNKCSLQFQTNQNVIIKRIGFCGSGLSTIPIISNKALKYYQCTVHGFIIGVQELIQVYPNVFVRIKLNGRGKCSLFVVCYGYLVSVPPPPPPHPPINAQRW